MIKRIFKVLWWMLGPDIMLRLQLRYLFLLALLFSFRTLFCICHSISTKTFQFLSHAFAHLFGFSAQLKTFQLRDALNHCSSYHEWTQCAHQLDILEDTWTWKEKDEHPKYDHVRLKASMQNLQTLMQEEDTLGLLHHLRTHLLRNICGIGNEELFVTIRQGTKTLIEQYLEQVCKTLEMLSLEHSSGMSNLSKLAFFREARHGLGRTALLLLEKVPTTHYSVGVLKALYENNLLPKIVCGSSFASLYVAALGMFTNDELLSQACSFWTPSFWQPFAKCKSKREFVYYLKQLFGETTFAEAFEHSGRVVNIIVAPEFLEHRNARLLNFTSSPNVVLWSAVVASCSGLCEWLSEPAEILEKHHEEVSHHYSPALRWRDGSGLKELPMERLSELFNVNHFVVSQSQHQLFKSHRQTQSILEVFRSFWISDLRHSLLDVLDVLPQCSRISSFKSLLFESFRGDVNLYPDQLSEDGFDSTISSAQSYTFSKLAVIINHCSVEYTLDECIDRLRQKLRKTWKGTAGSRSQSWSMEQFAILRENVYLESKSTSRSVKSAFDLCNLTHKSVLDLQDYS